MKQGPIGNIHKVEPNQYSGDTIVGTDKKGKLIKLDYPLKRVF